MPPISRIASHIGVANQGRVAHSLYSHNAGQRARAQFHFQRDILLFQNAGNSYPIPPGCTWSISTGLFSGTPFFTSARMCEMISAARVPRLFSLDVSQGWRPSLHREIFLADVLRMQLHEILE